MAEKTIDLALLKICSTILTNQRALSKMLVHCTSDTYGILRVVEMDRQIQTDTHGAMDAVQKILKAGDAPLEPPEGVLPS